MLSYFSTTQIKPFVWIALLIGLTILGYSTVYRAALGEKSRTDLTVYLTAAEAIKQNENIYAVENERHWHYVYLPLLAILLMPFTTLPLWLNALLWYLLSIAALVGTAWGLRSLFKNKEQSFWILLACFLLALPPLLNTFTRGQLGTINLFLSLLPFLLAQKNKNFLAGFILGFAIILKISPTLILPLYFLLQKNWRALAGCACGGLIFGILLPELIFEPMLSWEYLATYFHVISQGAGDQARQSYLWGELFTPFAADNQSFYAIATRFFWKDEINFLWKSNLEIRLANTGLIAVLTTGTTLAYFLNSRTAKLSPPSNQTESNFIVYSLLSCIMLFTSPVTQPHHYTPLVLLNSASFLLIQSVPALRRLLISVISISIAGFSLGMIFEPLALAGWPFLTSLALWSVVLLCALRKQ